MTRHVFASLLSHTIQGGIIRPMFLFYVHRCALAYERKEAILPRAFGQREMDWEGVQG